MKATVATHVTKRGDYSALMPSKTIRLKSKASPDSPSLTKDRGGGAGDTTGTMKRVIIIGAEDGAKELAEKLAASRRPSYEVVGFLTEAGAEPPPETNILGDASEMFEIARRHEVDEIIIATVPEWQRRLAENIVTNGNGHPKIQLVPSAYEAMVCYPRLSRVSDVPLMVLNCDRSWCQALAKRAFDMVFSVLALTATAPFLLVAAVLTRLCSRGPIFYRQPRVGKDGREFVLLKLRTMVDNAEQDTGPVLSSPTDGRVTSVGKVLRRLKIDELPQFVNVLKGEMSVIGPRPERRCFVEQFCRDIPGYNARHQVRPGITGLAQVYGNYASDPSTKLKYDLIYVYGSSLWTDLKVLAMTVPVLLSGN